MECEMPNYNPPGEEIQAILNNNKTIAVVGLSDKSSRDSYKVAKYMKEKGYTIIPVNPNVDEVLGEKSYASLKDIPVDIDIVDIFRKPEEIPAIVDAAIEKGTKVIWMQKGLAHNASAIKARDKGIEVVMSKCIMVEHKNML